MVYSGNRLWGVDLNAPSPISTRVQVPLDVEGTPLGWSSDGTELLLMREDPTDQTFPYDKYLYILHADGTETQPTTQPIGGTSDAAISPDGKRVVYVVHTGDEDETGTLYIVDADGGQPVRIADVAESPTFSPDGTQIAYLSAGEHVWVMNADGTDAREILVGEQGVSDLQWSPAGDRIAMANTLTVAIYTFAPDGSDFTEVISDGFNPYWSPDGSQIAYMRPYGEPLVGSPGLAIADTDGSSVRTFGFGSSGPWHPGTAETP
jgi:Tol biopolymer transport system component